MKKPIQLISACALLLLLLGGTAFTAPAPRFTAPTNETELNRCITQLRNDCVPFLRSLPKPLKSLIQLLVNTAGRDGNLLLNVAPRADGTFEPAQVARLREIGAWLKTNGESIYGTRGGPFLPDKDFASTCKGNMIYLHLLNGRREVVLPELGAKVRSVRLLAGGTVTTEEKTGTLRIRVGGTTSDKTDTIVVIALSQSAELLQPTPIIPGPLH